MSKPYVEKLRNVGGYDKDTQYVSEASTLCQLGGMQRTVGWAI